MLHVHLQQIKYHTIGSFKMSMKKYVDSIGGKDLIFLLLVIPISQW
jgi:hypothetical protein